MAGAVKWPRHATLSLIEIQSSLDSKYVDTRNKWPYTSQKMKKKGFDYSPKTCKRKWENLTRRYKDMKMMKKRDEEEGFHRDWPFYSLMDDVYNFRNINSPSLSIIETPSLVNQLPPNQPFRIIKLHQVPPNTKTIVIKGSPQVIDLNTTVSEPCVVDNPPNCIGQQEPAKAPTHEAKSTPVIIEVCPENNDLNTITSEPFADDTFPISSHLDPEEAVKVPTHKAKLSQAEFRAKVLELLRAQDRKLDAFRIELKERLEELQKVQEEELENNKRLVQIFENYCGNSTNNTD